MVCSLHRQLRNYKSRRLLYVLCTVNELNFMEHCPLLEANRSSFLSRNSPHFIKSDSSLRHLEKSATCPYPEPDQSSPCSQPTFCININIPSMPRPSKWLLSLRSPHQNPGGTCDVAWPSRSYLFDHPNNISWELQIVLPTVTFKNYRNLVCACVRACDCMYVSYLCHNKQGNFHATTVKFWTLTLKCVVFCVL
jgi:hypothetical protein